MINATKSSSQLLNYNISTCNIIDGYLHFSLLYSYVLYTKAIKIKQGFLFHVRTTLVVDHIQLRLISI